MEVYNRILSDMNIDGEIIESLYKYSPVYKFKYREKLWVLKTTKENNEKSDKLFQWENTLKENDINIVTPMEGNYGVSLLKEDKRWVVYPFVDGRDYNGSLKDIESAGELLGKIHKIGENNRILINGFAWGEYDEELYDELHEDIENIKETYKGKVDIEILDAVEKKISYYIEDRFSTLRSVNLPTVDGVWDYKAKNLIYEDNGKPTLIDPDNGGHIPRIMDLALALLLFHTDMESAEPRIFSIEEWEIFKRSYAKYVEITTEEKIHWQEMLDYVYVDEVLWAITDLEEDESHRQKEFIRSLIGLNLKIYEL